MRYNPWIEVNRAGQAARRKAYSGGRLPAPINRQFIGLQAFNVCTSSLEFHLPEVERFFAPALRLCSLRRNALQVRLTVRWSRHSDT
ncbi:hypothetical protein [Novosphingobium olei]|uniref:Uncharacterized protein n=1 Tax=Novosphingobium olei TaxID=2728851 RepID=A0A7Y0BQP7_9SPHN|nr:hypothetical protein [Novosphingobium olei]NML94540.1 hypothetical protein [Novosphingobium olei]